MFVEILVGGFIGLLLGMSGLGGPLIFVPLSILIFGYRPIEAIPLALGFIAVTRVIAFGNHYRKGNINFQVGRYFLIGSIPLSIIVAIVASSMLGDPTFEHALNTVMTWGIGALLMFFGLMFFFQSTLRYKKRKKQLRLNTSQKRSASTIGALCGTIVALTSIGEGSILTLFLALKFKMQSTQIVGTTLFISVITSGLSGLVYVLMGNVDLGLLLIFLVGSIPGVFVGGKLSRYAEGKALRVLIAIIVFLGGFLLVVSGL